MAYQAGEYAGALEHAQVSIGIDAEFWIGHIMRGQALQQMGQLDLALEEFTTAGRFSNHNSKAISFRGYVLAAGGRVSEAREVLRTLEGLSREKYVPPYAMALVTLGLGDKDATFDWLERAFTARDVHLIFLTMDPKWDPLRQDPRFKALLAKCGFTVAHSR